MASPTTNSRLSVAAAGQLMELHFGLVVKSGKPLMGEVDWNYFFICADGREVCLKITADTATIATELDFQVQLLDWLRQRELPFAVPYLLPARTGQPLVKIATENGVYWLRVQSWVGGRMLGDVNPRTAALRYNWGATAGHLSTALYGFDHPAAHRSYRWNPSETLLSRVYLADISDPELRQLAEHFWDYFAEYVQPRLAGLPRSVNYNDAHEHNLLVEGATEIVGVIDFGDALHTETVNELAIACAYAGMSQPDPLGAMTDVVRGYHGVFPLEAAEVEVLFGLTVARLLITVGTAAHRMKQEPGNAYLQISAAPAWALLKQLRTIAPALAHFTFREACGWSPTPNATTFAEWLEQSAAGIHPVIPLQDFRTVRLDFSVGSLDLGGNNQWLQEPAFSNTVRRMIMDVGGEAGVGGYGETRPFYTTDAYTSIGNNGPRWRTTHLGFDVWLPAGTPVYAPLAGKVHSFGYDPADRSYGATILVSHSPAAGLEFFTLYGHLSKASLVGLEVGQTIAQGTPFATIGDGTENGGWPPHLHFQVMLDDLDYRGDFPGVAYPEEAALWLGICPDPAPFFGKPEKRAIAAGPMTAPAETATKEKATPTEEILEERKSLLGRSLSLSYAQPLHMVRGWQQYLYDVSGRRYLDTVNNVAHVGHEHPAVVRAAQRQMAVLNTNTRYLHENLTAFARELTALFPPELSVVHFVNSGSEANELALRMAEAWTGSREMIAVEAGYHGNTGRTIEISSYKFDGKGGGGAPAHTHLLPLPDVYRGRYRTHENAGKDYAGYVDAILESLQQSGKKPAGVIVESILSCGGQVVLPAGYLREVYRQVRTAGGLCIADEVQVGLGRVGQHWWGFQLQGVVPDIVTIGKPIGNGHPLGAVVCTPAVADRFANGMEYFNTFGGNPVSCAVGRAVLRTIQGNGLRENALTTGDYLLEQLRALQGQFPIIGDVRGAGLFLGFELVTDPDVKMPARKQAAYLKNRMRQLGFLMSTDGPDENVLKIKPPLCFSRVNCDQLLDYLAQVLQEDAMQIG